MDYWTAACTLGFLVLSCRRKHINLMVENVWCTLSRLSCGPSDQPGLPDL